MKKVLALLTVMLMAVGVFAACGGSTSTPAGSTAPGASTVEPTGGVPKIGVVTPDADHGFTGESVAHARAELEALKADGKIDFMFGVGGEASKQIAEIESILQWGPDVIVLWPLEGEQLRNAATQIMDAGVKLIIYDRLIDGFTPTAEVMGDNVDIGKQMGEYILEYFAEELDAGEDINYLRFIGDSSTVSDQRSSGMDDVIAASDYAEQFTQVKDDILTNWSSATAQEEMENWLSTASDADIAALKLIVTHDDEVVDGVTIALQNYEDANPGKLQVKLVTGVGARRETLETYDTTVANGIDLVTYFFSPSMVRDAIRIGMYAVTGEQYNGQAIEGQILIPTIEVDKGNVEEFRNSNEFKERYSLDS